MALSTQDILRIFSSPSRAAAEGAVNGAADALRSQLPGLGAGVRQQADLILGGVRVQAGQAIDENKARLILALAEMQPQLRNQLSELARTVGQGAGQGAGQSAADSALTVVEQRLKKAAPWLVGGAVALVVGVGVLVYLSRPPATRQNGRRKRR